jgi:hypothetical protein
MTMLIRTLAAVAAGTLLATRLLSCADEACKPTGAGGGGGRYGRG